MRSHSAFNVAVCLAALAPWTDDRDVNYRVCMRGLFTVGGRGLLPRVCAWLLLSRGGGVTITAKLGVGWEITAGLTALSLVLGQIHSFDLLKGIT